MSTLSSTRGSLVPIVAVLALWFGLALAVGATGGLGAAPVPPPLIAFGLAAVGLASLALLPELRARLRASGPGPLVALHLVRALVGVVFLLQARRGVLPWSFAGPAGWGDLAVGLGAALVLARALPANTPARRRGLLAWNALGLLDILLVLANGARLFLTDPAAGAAFVRLPFALLPTFVVPLVLIAHALVFAWYVRADRSQETP